MNEFGNDLVVLTDDEGNEISFEHLDTYEQENETYMAFVPADADLNDSGELVILKVALDEKNNEEILVSIDDEDEYDRLFDIFMDRLSDYYELEDDEAPDDEGDGGIKQ